MSRNCRDDYSPLRWSVKCRTVLSILLMVVLQAAAHNAAPDPPLQSFTTVHHPPSAHKRVERQGTNSPLFFDQPSCTASVVENSPAGTEVARVQAQEGNERLSGELTYFLQQGGSTRYFSVDPSNGVITTRVNIDREDQDRHTFNVTVQNGGGASQIVPCTVQVLDENDNSPTFQAGSYYSRTVQEDLATGSLILNITVIDKDAGSNGTITYQLLNNTGGTFAIRMSRTGALLMLVGELDYETLDYYFLTLLAMDGGFPSHTTFASIQVFVSDVADTLPQFNASSYGARVPELTPGGSYILTVHATSQDSPDRAVLHYTILGGDPDMRFHLEAATGQLTLLQALDFETQEQYDLTVQAQSVSMSSLRAQTNVTIQVANENDNAPTFTRTQNTVSIPENATAGDHVLTASAEDLDSGPFGDVTYQLSSSDPVVMDSFTVNRLTGEVTTAVAFNNSPQKEYNFTIVAEDGGDPSLTTQMRVVVRVINVSNEAPTFNQPEYRVSVAEDVANGTTVLQVSAVATDNTSLQYFIQSGDTQGMFHLDNVEGLLITRRALDREQRSSYLLEVVASDGLLETTASVHITVTDVNDHCPVFKRSMYFATLSESRLIGSTVVEVRASDADAGANGTVTYSSSDISNEFDLNMVTGAISLRTLLDYEDTQSYQFTVVASDGGTPGCNATAGVEVTIEDENDNTPVFESVPHTGQVQENSPAYTSVLRLPARDADSGFNGALTFALIGDSRALRAFIVSSFGDILTRQLLDREVQATYRLTVEVRDGGQPPLSNTTLVTIHITDIVDSPPVFSQLAYEALITQEVPQGDALANISATTEDANASIVYEITSNSLFSIAQSTGVITAASSLSPRTNAGVYTVQVTARHRHLSESVPVTITIMSDNSAPHLQPLTVYFNAYPPLLQPTTNLGRVHILQQRANTSYTFSLQPSSPLILRHFSIEPTTGEISVSSSVPSGNYNLNVSASTAMGIGYGVVEVYIRILSNRTLESAVVVVFRQHTFTLVQLEHFTQFVAEIIPCSRQQVQVIGIQNRGSPVGEIVELAFAVQQEDRQGYISPDTILDRLAVHKHLSRPSTLLQFGSDICASEPCPHFQRCSPIVEVFRHSSQDVFQTRQSTGLYYLSHPFDQAFMCKCPVGFSRNDLCSLELNECDPSPCQFGAVCTDLVGDYRCDCPKWTLGKNCSIVCPSTSCGPCSPSPCLHGSSCTLLHQNSSHACSLNCPWSSKYQGPNCELTSLHFTSGSYAVFPPLGSTTRGTLSFRFATVAPNGMLLYTGQIGGHHDYLAVELLIGQLKVGVSLGGEAVVMTTESLQQLNDGRWHEVKVELHGQFLVVEVTPCLNGSRFVDGATESCRLQAHLPTDSRSLDVNSPLYLGGLETHLSELPLSSTSYQGCISSVSLNGALMDLGSPLRSHGTDSGCPPLDVTCSSRQVMCREGEECEEMWNGTVCSCGDNCQRAVRVSSGYLQLSGASTTTTFGLFELSFRTHSSGAVLAQFGTIASLELHYGTVVYCRSDRSHTLLADAFANDGLWHRVTLNIDDSFTQLTVDGSRVVSSLPEGDDFTVTTITLGAQDPLLPDGQLSGCLRDLVFNSILLNLHDVANSQESRYTTTANGTTMGCGNGDPCRTQAQCPEHSICVSGWESRTCQCEREFKPDGTQCAGLCAPNYCMNGVTCSVPSQFSPPRAYCSCGPQYSGERCELDGTCSQGFYGPRFCSSRCVCDPRGVQQRVCDGENGRCYCKSDLASFSPPGDLGCQPCDCHAPGSISSFCDDTTGQCRCLPGVGGRRCDRCADGFAGMDIQGCQAASVLKGSFSLPNVSYSSGLLDPRSTNYTSLASLIHTQLEKELYQFALPGKHEAEVTSFSNNDGMVRVNYHVSAYFPRVPPPLPTLPSPHTLAAVVQTIVQSGRLGTFRTDPDSHVVHLNCSSRPCGPHRSCYTITPNPQTFMCPSCPAGTRMDGVLCRTLPPQNCSGVDTDRDKIPDSCDNCPYVFNPSQAVEACRREEGVCSAELAAGVLWSPTSAGAMDSKPCPPPLAGVAVRRCLGGGTWAGEETANLSCTSAEGQGILAQVAALSEYWEPTVSQLLFTVSSVKEFTRGGRVEFGGDLQAVGMLIDQLLSLHHRLRGTSLSDHVLQSMVLTVDHILDPGLTRLWGVVRDGYSSVDLLATLEQLANRTTTASLEGESLPLENLDIATLVLPTEQFNGSVFELAVNDTSAVVSLPPDISSPSSTLHIAVAQFATIGTLLPNSLTFNLSRNFTVATPLVSVQVWGEGVTTHTLPTPVILTLEYGSEVEQYEDAVCVFWDDEGSGGWSQEGCQVMAEHSNATHCSCNCSHLTAFAVLLPLPTPPPPPSPVPVPDRYIPKLFTYIVLGLISLLLLITLLLAVFLLCLSSECLQKAVHLQLVIVLLFTTLTFLAGIDRTEVSWVCATLGVVEVLLVLVCLSWLLSEAVLLVCLLLHSTLKRTFLIYFTIIGWVFPLLLCVIAIGTVVAVNDSFVTGMGFPDHCWLSSEMVWAFVAPAALLLTLYVVVVLVAVMILVKQHNSTPQPDATSKHRIIVSLYVSVGQMVLLVLTWVFGLLMIYLHDHQWLEYVFVSLYATLGVLVFIKLCLTDSKMREVCCSKLLRKDKNGSIDASTFSDEVLNNRRMVHPQDPPDVIRMQRLPPRPAAYLTATPSLTASTTLTASPTTLATSSLTHINKSDTASSDPRPWYTIPPPTPLSPLTSGSETDLELPPGPQHMDSVREEPTSPSLSELYQRVRGGSPQNYLEYQCKEKPPPTPPPTEQQSFSPPLAAEEQPSSTPLGKEDPLWYRTSHLEITPMPYERVAVQHSVWWSSQEEPATDDTPSPPQQHATHSVISCAEPSSLANTGPSSSPSLQHEQHNPPSDHPSPHRQHNPPSDQPSPNRQHNPPSDQPSPNRQHNPPSDQPSPNRQHNPPSDQPSPNRQHNPPSDQPSPNRQHNPPSDQPSPNRQHNPPSDQPSPHRQHNPPSDHPSPHRQHNPPSNQPSPNRQHNPPSDHPSSHRQHNPPSDQPSPNRQHNLPSDQPTGNGYLCNGLSTEGTPRVRRHAAGDGPQIVESLV